MHQATETSLSFIRFVPKIRHIMYYVALKVIKLIIKRFVIMIIGIVMWCKHLCFQKEVMTIFICILPGYLTKPDLN